MTLPISVWDGEEEVMEDGEEENQENPENGELEHNNTMDFSKNYVLFCFDFVLQILDPPQIFSSNV